MFSFKKTFLTTLRLKTISNMNTTLTIVVFAVLLQMVSGETLENELQRKLAKTKENPSQEKVIGLVQDITVAYRYEDDLTPSLL